MFSKACKYAIRSVIFIAVCSLKKEKVGFKEIAKEIDAPEAFTAKILQMLAREGLIDSTKGVGGGFNIPLHRLDTTRLSEVVRLIDGDEIFQACALGLPKCSEEQPCPLHHKFTLIKADLIQALDHTSFKDLAENINLGDSFLKI